MTTPSQRDDALPKVDLEHVRLRRTGWVPVWLSAAVVFAFVLGMGKAADPVAARLVLAAGSAAAAAAVVLLGQVILALTGRRHFHFLQPMPSREALEEERRQILTAVKELDFDRAMNKIGEADYEDLKARYEAEGLRVIEAIDAERRRWERRAMGVAGRHLREVGLEPLLPFEAEKAESRRPGPEPPPAVQAAAGTAEAVGGAEAGPQACPGCGTVNDADAVFCKRCGARVAGEEVAS